MQRSVWMDLKYGMRILSKSPRFSITIVLILAIAVGGNIAIFSIVESIFLSPLPYPHGEQLVQITRYTKGAGEHDLQSSSKLIFLRDHNSSFQFVAGSDAQPTGLNLTGNGETRFVSALGVSADFFRALHVKPILGRDFQAGDDHPNASKVVVLSYSAWEHVFRSDSAIIGKTVNLSGDSYTVVGIMPASFQSVPESELWFPLSLTEEGNANKYQLFARLRDNVGLAQAQADIDRNLTVFRHDFPKSMLNDEQAHVRNYRERLVGNVRGPLFLLFAAVWVVLLIACTNISNLLLARASSRAHEIAVRAALGAKRRWIVQQMLVENAVLAFAGVLSGLLLAHWILPILVSISPVGFTFVTRPTMNAQVLAYALLLVLGSIVMFGAFPAWHGSGCDINGTLREASQNGSWGRRQIRLIEILVTAEVACCIVLLIGAGLLIKTFSNLADVHPGFESNGVLVAHMSLRGSGATATMARLYGAGLEEIKTLPGVEDAAIISCLPFERGMNLPFDILTGANDPNNQISEWRYITPGYFKVMHTPVITGRPFNDSDSANANAVVIISEAFAQQYFPHSSPLNQQLRLGRFGVPSMEDRARQIVGVVGDVRQSGLERPAPPIAYVPASQVPDGILQITHNLSLISWIVRRKTGFDVSTGALQEKIIQTDPYHPFAGFQPLSSVVTNSIAQQKFNMLIIICFAALALVLAVVGLHGVISYSVSLRVREIGIRMALGALPADILRIIIMHALKLVLAGAALGVLLAFICNRVFSKLLFGVSASDPGTLVAVLAVTVVSSILACYMPVRAAIKVDPLIALKYD